MGKMMSNKNTVRWLIAIPIVTLLSFVGSLTYFLCSDADWFLTILGVAFFTLLGFFLTAFPPIAFWWMTDPDGRKDFKKRSEEYFDKVEEKRERRRRFWCGTDGPSWMDRHRQGY